MDSWLSSTARTGSFVRTVERVVEVLEGIGNVKTTSFKTKPDHLQRSFLIRGDETEAAPYFYQNRSGPVQ